MRIQFDDTADEGILDDRRSWSQEWDHVPTPDEITAEVAAMRRSWFAGSGLKPHVAWNGETGEVVSPGGFVLVRIARASA